MLLCLSHSDPSTALVLYGCYYYPNYKPDSIQILDLLTASCDIWKTRSPLSSKSSFKSGHTFIKNYSPNATFLIWLGQYFTGFIWKENNVRRKSMLGNAWWRDITPVLLKCQSSGPHIQLLYGFVSLQSSGGFYFQKYKRWHCPANQIPSFSRTKLPSSYAVLDFLLHLTQNSRASASWWSIPFTCLFLLAIWEVLQFYATDQVNTNSEQLHNQMKNFTAVSSGNILGSVLFECPLLPNCGNLWTLFHQLPVSVHSRGVSIYIAVWWWQWPDRPQRLPPLLKAISLQRCQKPR